MIVPIAQAELEAFKSSMVSLFLARFTSLLFFVSLLSQHSFDFLVDREKQQLSLLIIWRMDNTPMVLASNPKTEIHLSKLGIDP